ncbi:uncharacterized protein LOC111917042 [Lactuca sativa]|uniref:uncharacterized protein LOC111917042 n=1 Tax=Lactuca sativa TaxID=4236 RepID=UPI0022AEB5D2|nr:uncharacterized protein LOC111917042 [Lactuca sativa]
MHSDYKLPTVGYIDRVISAEIPNKDDDPELDALVSEFMMHGPCGSDNPKCPCMIDNKCSKNFPKTFTEHTSVDENGYPIYRRRNDGSFVEKSGVKLDNRNVAPYHKLLLKRYQAHINVEWCNQGASIKYLFKYINKGPDRATVAVVPNNNADDNDDVVDEIKNYYNYMSACEASWHIFKFDVHFRTPSVARLPFHLPGQQNVVYGADDDIEDVLNKQSVSSSMFLTWMECNEHNKEARLSLDEDHVKNLTLYDIEIFLLQNNSSLKDFDGMPYPDHESISSSNNRLITEELDFDRMTLLQEFYQLLGSLTDEQRGVFDDIITNVKKKKGGVFFVYGYGGTGKTFLWKTLSAALRSEGEIVLNVASSGIASFLLTGGRTAHSRFIIPLNLTGDSFCSITPESDVAELLKKTSLIIWDDAPMIHKHAFEALDRSLKDILGCHLRSNSKLLFGGKAIVFGGDFRQILPVVPNGSRQDIVNASISSSYIWSNCKVLRLTKNMRLSLHTSNIEETTTFANWILNIGEGKVGGLNDGETIVDIPDDILITDLSYPIGSLITFVYPSIVENANNPMF